MTRRGYLSSWSGLVGLGVVAIVISFRLGHILNSSARIEPGKPVHERLLPNTTGEPLQAAKEGVLIIIDEAAFEQFHNAMGEAKDKVFNRLMEEHRLIGVKKGTRLNYINGDDERAKIQVREGRHMGFIGWVEYKDLLWD